MAILKFILLTFTTIAHNEISARIFPAPLQENTYAWIDITYPGDAYLLRPDPAGLEDENETYLCSATIPALDEDDERVRPGVLWIEGGEIYCRVVAHQLTVRKFDEFKMLHYTPGSLSWEVYNGKLPEKPIYGGEFDNKNPIPICRTKFGPNVYVGTFEDSYCLVSTEETDEAINVDPKDMEVGEVEILAENLLTGKKIP